MTDRPRATAGVLLSRTAGALEVALVHRPRYDDWTLPKGGVEPREHLIETARREAAEETGLTVTLGRRLPSTRYARPGGTTSVSWWSATPGSPTGTARGDEVDELRWVTPDLAAELLSYPSDRNLLRELKKRPIASGTVILVRHASAGDRHLWKGPDAKRPLDRGGLARAERLASILPAFAPATLVAATPLRCRETLEPLAAVLGVGITLDRRFDDTGWQRGPGRAVRALAEVSAAKGTTVVCSQGETIPGVIADLAQSRASKAARSDIRKASNGSGSHRTPRCRKGSFWVLSFHGGELIAADYIAE